MKRRRKRADVIKRCASLVKYCIVLKKQNEHRVQSVKRNTCKHIVSSLRGDYIYTIIIGLLHCTTASCSKALRVAKAVAVMETAPRGRDRGGMW